MEDAMAEHVRIEVEDGVMTLTLNRPEKKNALTEAMYVSLADAIAAADDDPAVRCVLIQAQGDIFTAGNDLGDFVVMGEAAAKDGVEEDPASLNPLLIMLARAKTPIVAAVHGRAVGIGVTLLLHCDLVVVAEDALLSTPFVNLALIPEAASTLLLPARIGHARAFAMFVLGEPITGLEAARLGLANVAVPAHEVRAKARAYAGAVAARPPAAVAITKALMRDVERLSAVVERENGHFAALLRSPEAREAFQAFAERRRPDFVKLAASESV
jgi:enoyl-CoA hydratase/carnithine racemase